MRPPVPPAKPIDAAEAPLDRAPADARVPSAGSNSDAPQPLKRFSLTRFWRAWSVVLWLKLAAALPVQLSLALHARLGRWLYRIDARRAHVVRRNLEICFPELGPHDREDLVERHFESFGMSIAEYALAWFAPARKLEGRFEIEGLHHVLAALARGRGAILYTGHFHSIDICGWPLKRTLPRFACMFSHRSNALLDEIQRRGRLRIAHEQVPDDNVRALLRALAGGAAVWYAPDQMYAQGALVPFFGEPAMTNLATAKLARVSGAPVVPFSYRRSDTRGRYALEFHAPLEGIPSGDALADTARLAHVLEGFVRAAPEQYHWLHRRFKGRPDGWPDVYRRD